MAQIETGDLGAVEPPFPDQASLAEAVAKVDEALEALVVAVRDLMYVSQEFDRAHRPDLYWAGLARWMDA
jgi:hypothetical protein